MRKISLLLALILLLTAFLTACNGTTDTSDISSNTASEASAETSTPDEESQASIYKDPVRDGALETVVSTGASYTKSEEASATYPDTYGNELTDGIRATTSSYTQESVSGYNINNKILYVNVDLGYVCDNLYMFKVSYLATTIAGINVPSRMSVEISENGKDWKSLRIMKKPEFVEGTIQEATLTLDKYVSARYVRFAISGSSSWVFLDEVMVIADVEANNANELFTDAVNNAYSKLGVFSAPKTGVSVNRDLAKTLISKGKSYTSDGKTLSNFADTGKMLTDGTFSGYYEGGTWVGFESGKDIVVTVDLGKDETDIASVEGSFYTNTSTGLYMPVAMKAVAISSDGTRTDLGIVYASTTRVSGDYTFALQFSEAVSARKIEFTLVATESTMILVEELAVYAYREAEEQTSLYPLLNLETGATNWPSSTKNYNDYTNLIRGKTQQIVVGSEPAKSAYENNTPITSTLMTDGKFSTSTGIHNGFFFKFNYGGTRTVIYDLEHTSSVDKFTASFTHQTAWAVNSPSTVTVLVSPDGSKWYEAGIMTMSGNADPSIYKGTLTLDKAVKARYVAFSFAVTTWAGCDELEVYGKKNASSASDASKAGLNEVKPFINKRKEPSDSLLGGAKDLTLLYHGVNTAYTESDLLPYLAYLDENGTIKDTMFDSFLFLLTGNFPSNALPYSNGILSDWLWAINDLFVDGENLMALENAAGKVKNALDLPDDFKYKVTMSIYYPSADMTNFGDIDGDGETENFTILSERIQAIETYIDLFEKKFAEQNFKNVELVGYYWYHEAINSNDTESLELINAVSDAVHKVGKDFFWIPYFQSNGYESWDKYGFDVACMQPNYVFKLDTPYSNIPNCAALTKLHGMGVEMEICSEALTDERFFKKYMQYLEGGITYGYMSDCVIMYYQGVFDFRNACNSKSAMGRMVYDYTYSFIKDSLSSKPKTLAPQIYEAEKNTPLFGTFEFENDLLKEFKIAVSPEYGTVTLNYDGTFTYYPEKDFTGEVKFSISYSEYLGWSDPCEITINVK